MPKSTVPIIMADGSIADLMAITADQVDLGTLAATLSKIVRWSGRHDGQGISVAQHSVMGADALFREHGDPVMAGYFLLHDGHEYLLGDINRPSTLMVETLVQEILAERGVSEAERKGVVKEATERAKARLDSVIWQAAKLAPIQRMPIYARLVAEMDERMCHAEAKVLYRVRDGLPLVRCDLPAPKLTAALLPWGAMKAEMHFVERLDRYLGIALQPREVWQ